jgi:predicted transcriptional regulator
MPKSAATVPTSVRLSSDMKSRLEAVARRRKRSQSFVVEEALRCYLDAPSHEGAEDGDGDPLHAWRQFIGVGARLGLQRTAEEIDADIRDMREDRKLRPDP